MIPANAQPQAQPDFTNFDGIHLGVTSNRSSELLLLKSHTSLLLR